MQSKQKLVLLLLLILFCGATYGKEDVKIILDDFVSKDSDSLRTRDLVKAGNKLYKKGADYYDEALQFYEGALIGNSTYAPLNYRIGVCYLHTNNKKAALSYFEKCPEDISPTYKLMLGRAYHFNMMFDEAIVAYDAYYNNLEVKQQRKVAPNISKFIQECRNGKTLMPDSLWATLEPLSALNSPEDEFQPFYAYQDSTFFFSSNRNSKRRVNEDFFFVSKDQVFLSVDTSLVLKTPSGAINSKANNAALGYNPSLDAIIAYNGKIRNGDLLLISKNKKGELKKTKPLDRNINSKEKEGTAVFPDLKTLVFSSNREKGIGGMDLYASYLNEKGKWGKATNLGSLINTPFDEEVCGISVDGKTLYFTSQGHNSMGGLDVFFTRINAQGEWSKPHNMGYPINTPDHDLSYIPLDTNKAIVVGIRPEGEGGMDMFRMIFKYPEDIEDNHFSLKGKVIDSESLNPIDGAQVTLYNVYNDSIFTEITTDTSGFFYNWFPEKESVGIRVKAKGYKPFLKVFDQDINADTLFFESIEMLAEDVLVEEVISYNFSVLGQVKDIQTNDPILAVVEILNESDSLLARLTTKEGSGRYRANLNDIRNSYYFKISANGYVAHDELLVFDDVDSTKKVIHNFMLNPMPKKESLMFSGRVMDANTGEPLVAEMKFIDPVTQKETIIYPDSITGRYDFRLNAHHSMVVELRKENYFFAFEMIPAPSDKEEKLVKKDFQMKQIKKGEKIVLNNILFQTGKSILTKESYVELDKLVRVMVNSKINVEISGHTDNTGGYALNKKLSESRAKAVVDYLIASGIETSRLKYAGYGPDQPVATNETKDGRAKNRRVEMKILD